MRAQLVLGLGVSLGSLFACNKDVAGPACTGASECEEGQACVDGECADVQCLSSADCDIGQHCGDDNACSDGCADNDDCIAGEICGERSGECQPRGCRTTELDCELGERCDQTTGQCYKDDSGHCGSCDWLTSPTCPGGECVIWTIGEEQCGNDNDCASGESCGDFTIYGLGRVCHVDYCLQSCNPNAEGEPCPRGFDCGKVYQEDEWTACVSDCGFMHENGYAR